MNRNKSAAKQAERNEKALRYVIFLHHPAALGVARRPEVLCLCCRALAKLPSNRVCMDCPQKVAFYA